jgi:hypothetical protein
MRIFSIDKTVKRPAALKIFWTTFYLSVFSLQPNELRIDVAERLKAEAQVNEPPHHIALSMPKGSQSRLECGR